MAYEWGECERTLSLTGFSRVLVTLSVKDVLSLHASVSPEKKGDLGKGCLS